MALVVMSASAFGRTVRATRALAYAVTVLLLIDPFLLHSLGFWLSVGATFGIAMLAGPLARRVPGARVVRESLAVAIAAQVGVFPVLVASGAGLPWVAPAANLLAVPAAEPICVIALPVAFIAADVGALAVPVLFAVTLLLAWVRFVAHLAHRAPLVVTALALVLAVGVTVAERAVASRR
jgi:competence protein ComEC